MNERHYIKNKRAEIDRCNICSKIDKLSWDHVPPKSVLLEPDTYADRLFSNGYLPTPDNCSGHFQSGIKYRNICERCNNIVLGENDKFYKDFVVEVDEKLKLAVNAKTKGIIIPDYIIVNTKINRVLRAVCGHMLAMKSSYDENSIIDEYLRRYVLDESMIIKDFFVFSWLYTYKTILNVRDITVHSKNENSHPKGLISIMSSYPLSFIISDKNETNCLLDDLGRKTTSDIDQLVDVKIHFITGICAGTKNTKCLNWPVDISNDENGVMFALASDKTVEDSRIAVTENRRNKNH